MKMKSRERKASTRGQQNPNIGLLGAKAAKKSQLKMFLSNC